MVKKPEIITDVYTSDARGRNRRKIGSAGIHSKGVVILMITEPVKMGETISLVFLEELEAETVSVV